MPKAHKNRQGITPVKNGFRVRVGCLKGRYVFDEYVRCDADQAIRLRDLAISMLNKKGWKLVAGRRNGHFLDKPTRRNSSGFAGVNWLKAAGGHTYWTAEIMHGGEKLRKHFSIKKHGDDALVLAVEQRRAWEAEFTVEEDDDEN
jgi:hypothetical protein